MNTYRNGQAVRLSCDFKNLAGADADPTTVALSVRKPDGTVDTFTYAGAQVVKDSTGNYHYDYSTTTQAGAYVYAWSGTGALQADYKGTFMVLATYS